MKILGNLFGGGAIKAVGKIVDEVFTSQDEKNQAMIAITKIEAELKLFLTFAQVCVFGEIFSYSPMKKIVGLSALIISR